MTSDRRLDELISGWLIEEAPAQAPDRVLSRAFARTRGSRQQVGWWGALRRIQMFRPMAMRYYVVVGVLALTAIVGLAVLGGPSAIAPGQSPSPTPSTTITPQPAPTDAAAPEPTPRDILTTVRELEPGEWYMGFPVRADFTVPAPGWHGDYFSRHAAGLVKEHAWLWLHTVANVYASPCQPVEGVLRPPIGPTVDDLAAALAELQGPEVTGPNDVVIDGYAGRQLTLTATGPLDDCMPAPDSVKTGDVAYTLWRTPDGGMAWFESGDFMDVRILDVDGTRLVIFTGHGPDATDEEMAELQQIFDSIRLAPRDQ